MVVEGRPSHPGSSQSPVTTMLEADPPISSLRGSPSLTVIENGEKTALAKNTVQRSKNTISPNSAELTGAVNSGADLEAARDIDGTKPIIVDWDEPEDPANPYNWSKREKWIATGIFSLFTVLSPISSSMIAPAAETQIAAEFHLTNSTEIATIISIFVLGYAFGPLVLGPLSEIYGRIRVLQSANLFYLIWNLVCGFSKTPAQLIVFRFLAGLGGSAPLAIGAGTISDLWRPEERGYAIALFSLAPLLGPVLGPITGSWIAEKSTWKWVFWSTSIFCGVVQILGFIFLQETYAPVILSRKAGRLRKEKGVKPEEYSRVVTVCDVNENGLDHVLVYGIIRPFTLFFNEPILQVLALYLAFTFGLNYLVLTTIPGIFLGIYKEDVGIAGLNYIALGVGFTGTSQIAARRVDGLYARLKAKNGGAGKPEYRLPFLFVGSILLPAGLIITGWCAQEHVHWIVVDIGFTLISSGIVLANLSIQTYIIDAFTRYAASAIAAATCLRSVAGFAFPLFAGDMYKALGYGKGNTILAAIAFAVGCPATWISGSMEKGSETTADTQLKRHRSYRIS